VNCQTTSFQFRYAGGSGSGASVLVWRTAAKPPGFLKPETWPATVCWLLPEGRICRVASLANKQWTAMLVVRRARARKPARQVCEMGSSRAAAMERPEGRGPRDEAAAPSSRSAVPFSRPHLVRRKAAVCPPCHHGLASLRHKH
jgi:hypothetical protein